MEYLLETIIGRLRLSAYAEGITLILLLGGAIPMKLVMGQPSMLWMIAPLQIATTAWYLINTLNATTEYKWNFGTLTWKVLICCFIPFGTYYIDRQILRHIKPVQRSSEEQVTSF